MDTNTVIAIASVVLLIGILISMGIGRVQDRLAARVKGSQEAQRLTVSEPPAHPPAGNTALPVPGPGPGPGTMSVPGRNLTERELIVLLASQKTGLKWRYSGKKIYTLVGGNHDQFLALVREIRGDQDEADAPDDLTLTPIANRRTRASYYPDEPELEFKPPS